MAINSIMSSGVQGMQHAYGEITRAADQIAKAGTQIADPNTQADDVGSRDLSSMDVVEPLVNMKMEQHIFDASAKIVKTADDLLGTLMDIRV